MICKGNRGVKPAGLPLVWGEFGSDTGGGQSCTIPPGPLPSLTHKRQDAAIIHCTRQNSGAKTQ